MGERDIVAGAGCGELRPGRRAAGKADFDGYHAYPPRFS
jgi:hypothetical protein